MAARRSNAKEKAKRRRHAKARRAAAEAAASINRALPRRASANPAVSRL